MTLSPALKLLAEARQEFADALKDESASKIRVGQARYKFMNARAELRAEDSELLELI